MKENWTYKKLGEVVTIIMGQSPSSDTYNESEGLPFFQGNADFGEVYPNVRIYCNAPIRIANNGDVLISVRAPIGAINIADRKCCIGRGLAAIRGNEKNQSRFIYYLLLASKEKLVAQGTGSTFKSIGKDTLYNLLMPFVSLETQSRIVSELDLLQSIIDKQKAQLKELDNLAQAVFYDMFGDPVENDKEWETAELNDVCDVRDGTHDSPSYYEDGYPLITSKNVIDGKISFEDVNYISKEDFDNISKRSRVDDGDIIMPMIGTIGKPVVVKKDREFAIKNVALIKFISDSKVVNVYIQAIMSSKAFDIYMKSKNRGGNQKFIALGDIRKLKVSVPPLSLQQSFAAKIESIEKQKAAITQSIAETQRLFDFTMDKYFG